MLGEKELIYLDSLCKTLGNPSKFMSTEIGPLPIEVLVKCLNFPVDKVFPAVDLYRLFLMHPSSAVHYNGADAGATYISLLSAFLVMKDAPNPVIMLTLRALANLF